LFNNSDLLHCGSPQPLQRAEPLEEALATHLAQAGHVVEEALDHALGPPGAVVGDREAVRLVTDPLQQVEALAGARQDDRVLLRGQPHLLEPLREAGHGGTASLPFGEVAPLDLEVVAFDSPHVAVGSVQQIVEQLEAARERWGFAYIEVSSSDAEAIAPVLERLRGR